MSPMNMICFSITSMEAQSCASSSTLRLTSTGHPTPRSCLLRTKHSTGCGCVSYLISPTLRKRYGIGFMLLLQSTGQSLMSAASLFWYATMSTLLILATLHLSPLRRSIMGQRRYPSCERPLWRYKKWGKYKKNHNGHWLLKAVLTPKPHQEHIHHINNFVWHRNMFH